MQWQGSSGQAMHFDSTMVSKHTAWRLLLCCRTCCLFGARYISASKEHVQCRCRYAPGIKESAMLLGLYPDEPEVCNWTPSNFILLSGMMMTWYTITARQLVKGTVQAQRMTWHTRYCHSAINRWRKPKTQQLQA